MKTIRLQSFIAALATVVSATAAGPVLAWPEAGKPVRIIVGFPAGGGADTLARALSQSLGEKIGTPVVVENKPGAGGMLATDFVSKAAPDGYTLYMATPGSFTIWPNLRKLPYDAEKDFAAVSLLVTMPNLLVTSPNVPYRDVRSLIAAAKAPGAKMDYASGGTGTLDQIAAEQFNTLAGISLAHVAYKGTAPKLNDVMAGLVPITFSDPSAKVLIDGGKLNLLAVTTRKRSRLFPDTPTMDEAGVPGYDVMNWYGIVAPAGTPAVAVDKLNNALNEIMSRPEIRTRLEGVGMEATSSTPAEFNQLMAGERAKWAALVVKVGMKAD